MANVEVRHCSSARTRRDWVCRASYTRQVVEIWKESKAKYEFGQETERLMGGHGYENEAADLIFRRMGVHNGEYESRTKAWQMETKCVCRGRRCCGIGSAEYHLQELSYST